MVYYLSLGKGIFMKSLETFERFLENEFEKVTTPYRDAVKKLTVLEETKARNLLSTEQFINTDKFKHLHHRYVLIKNWFRLIENSKKGQDYQFYSYFHQLSLYLEKHGFHVSDNLNLIMYYMECNINHGILEEEMKKIKEEQFELKMVPIVSFIKEMISMSRVPLEENKFDDIRNTVTLNTFILVEAHRTLQQHYFSKKDSYDENDIAESVNALCQLKVQDNVCIYFEEKLRKKLETRKQNQTKPKDKVVQSPTIESKPSKKYLTDQEYKALRKQVSKYYDIYHAKMVSPMTEEERMMTANFMIRMGLSKEELETYFKRTEPEYEYKNPLALLSLSYEKLKYYEEKLGLQETLKTMKEYVQEMFIAQDEDYNFWKQNLQSELNRAIASLPSHYEYEYAQAQKVKSCN